MVLWSKALGMSSAFYLVAVMGDLAVVLVGHLKAGKGQVHLRIFSNEQ